MLGNWPAVVILQRTMLTYYSKSLDTTETVGWQP